MPARKIKIFADGADREAILRLYRQGQVQGFTTNPTLMRKAGVADYERFAREILSVVTDAPVSFEVFSDEFDEMRRQALKIAGWGGNVYVKIPVTNTRGESAQSLIRSLSSEGVKLNVTAILTLDQVHRVCEALAPCTPGIVSVFAGRIADAGVDPLPIMCGAREMLSSLPAAELLWASCREVFNIIQAEQAGCHIITVTHDLLQKLGRLGRPLEEVSLETVKMFYHDAKAAGFGL
jgi:transaldolase